MFVLLRIAAVTSEFPTSVINEVLLFYSILYLRVDLVEIIFIHVVSFWQSSASLGVRPCSGSGSSANKLFQVLNKNKQMCFT